jgi:alpha-beta hydrolase superfamily lysophospholipase
MIQEQEIRFRSGEIELAGTTTLPDPRGIFPGVVFISGSGPIDRNENHKKIRINAFHDISNYLAQNGIASFRYDKRGVGQSKGKYLKTGFNDNAMDAIAALEFFGQQSKIDSGKIFMLGHSEGAVIAAKLAGAGVKAAGVILLAGTAQSGEAVMKWQAKQVVKKLKGLNGWIIKTFNIDVSKAQQKQFDRINKSTKDRIRIQLFIKLNAKWFREFMAYDPSVDLSKITVAVLAITGSKDIQVDPADLERMAGLVKAPFEHHLIRNMTHMLRIEEGEASVSNYSKELKKPVESEMLKIILKWLENRINPASKPQT